MIHIQADTTAFERGLRKAVESVRTFQRRCKQMPNAPKQYRPAGQPSKQERAKQYDQRRGSSSSRGYGGKRWQWLRMETFKRDGFRCQAHGCGVFITMRKGDAHCDHIISKANGGTDDLSNLQTLCDRCHHAKTARGE